MDKDNKTKQQKRREYMRKYYMKKRFNMVDGKYVKPKPKKQKVCPLKIVRKEVIVSFE